MNTWMAVVGIIAIFIIGWSYAYFAEDKEARKKVKKLLIKIIKFWKWKK